MAQTGRWSLARRTSSTVPAAALSGLLASATVIEPEPVVDDQPRIEEPAAVRFVIALGIAVVSAGAAALLSFLASGSLGPGRLAEFGPRPGPVALAVGIEVLIGAAILLLAPVGRSEAARGSGHDEGAGAAAAPSVTPDERPQATAERDAAPETPRIPDLDDTADLAAIAAAWSGLRPSSAPTPEAGVPDRKPGADAVTEPIELPRLD